MIHPQNPSLLILSQVYTKIYPFFIYRVISTIIAARFPVNTVTFLHKFIFFITS